MLTGIRPDYQVEVHPRILEERGGPMLRHGLQGMHGTGPRCSSRDRGVFGRIGPGWQRGMRGLGPWRDLSSR